MTLQNLILRLLLERIWFKKKIVLQILTSAYALGGNFFRVKVN